MNQEVYSTTDKPYSLFTQCVHFIAENINDVESFVGFPSQMGYVLFKATVKTPQFQREENIASKALGLFVEAFHADVLSKLNIAGHHLVLNYYLDQFLLFTSLVSLDVSRCGLGDQHEILTHFSNLTSLKTLVLKNNALSNTGIQRMTTPFRMFGRGPSHLTQLDLSGNSGITSSCLKYLSPFSQLSTVILQNCKIGRQGDWTLRGGDATALCIQTTGWATGVIESWIEQSQAKIRQKPRREKSWFYSRASRCPHITGKDQMSDQPIKLAAHVVVAERVRKDIDSKENICHNSSCEKMTHTCTDITYRPHIRHAGSHTSCERDSEADRLMDIYRREEAVIRIASDYVKTDDTPISKCDVFPTKMISLKCLDEEKRGSIAPAAMDQRTSEDNTVLPQLKTGDESHQAVNVFSQRHNASTCNKDIRHHLLNRTKLQPKECTLKRSGDSKKTVGSETLRSSGPKLLNVKPIAINSIEQSIDTVSDQDSRDSINSVVCSKPCKRRKILIDKRPWNVEQQRI